jgi:hypothetical protein
MHKDADAMDALLKSGHRLTSKSKMMIGFLPTDPAMMQAEHRVIKMFDIPDTLRRMVCTIARYLGYQPR